MKTSDRGLIYLGSTKKDLEKLPEDVKDVFTMAIRLALMGEKHEDAKPFIGHGSGVFEVVKDYKGDTFRELYTVKYEEIIFILHIFQKKSNKGKKTPKVDIEMIQSRIIPKQFEESGV